MLSLSSVVDFLLMLSIGGVMGLVIALHIKLRRFSEEAGKVPALADDLTRAITTSRDAMQGLAKAAKTDGARLEEALSRAESVRQDLVYILDRAEKVLQQFDRHLEKHPVVPHAETIQNNNAALGGASAGASTAAGVASQTSRPPQGANQQLGASANAPAKSNPGDSEAAVMPGRYQSRFGVDQNGNPRPYKPASYQSGAAAYGASNRQYDQQQTDADDAGAIDAESELRRALEKAI